MAVFHIDPSRSGEAAQVLLGDRLDAVLITDAYAGYNGIDVKGRQSGLAHLVRKAGGRPSRYVPGSGLTIFWAKLSTVKKINSTLASLYG